MRDRDNLILCCSLQCFVVIIWYLLKEVSFPMEIFFLHFLFLFSSIQSLESRIPVYGISNIQVLLYSILYCYLKSASITFYQISASFAHWLICWNCAYDCKMFILVHKAMALKSGFLTFTLDLKQGLCAQKADEGDGIG